MSIEQKELQKIATMAAYAAVEPSGVQDSEHGGEILISTSARIAFRKVFPDWKGVRNKWLNKAIAEAFKKAKPAGGRDGFFKPIGSGAWTGLTGEVRVYGGTRYIAIVMQNDDVRIISVKGTPSGIGTPTGDAIPRRNPVPGSKPGAVDFGPSSGAASVGSALKGV